MHIETNMDEKSRASNAGINIYIKQSIAKVDRA